jgi:hypothetical protein
MSPFALAHWSRFDILIKWAYSGYMMREHRLFETSADLRANNLAQEVYIEHERALNGLWDTRTTTQKTSMGSFHELLRSMKRNGFNHSLAIPVCSNATLVSGTLVKAAVAVDGADRIAATLALGLPSVTVRHLPHGQCHGPEYNYRWFERRGYAPELFTWVMHRVICADPSLHVLHLSECTTEDRERSGTT